MAEAILDLRLDTVQPNRVRLVYGVQNDYNSRYICARFTVNGKPIDIEKTAAVRINAKRPDGNKDAFPGTVNTDGTAKVPVAQWMLDVPGEVSASITAVTTSGALTTQEFYIMAKASIWDSTGEPSAENPDKDVLQTIIASENERVAAESTRVANESARKSAETARATAETKRIADEAERVANEAGRVSAEEIRREEFATWQDEWGKISSFDKRIENLEAAVSPEIVTPVTDSTVAYTKTVPKGVLPNAAITEIGGMSYVKNGVLVDSKVEAVESMGLNLYNENYYFIERCGGKKNADGSYTVHASKLGFGEHNFQGKTNTQYTVSLTITNATTNKATYVIFYYKDGTQDGYGGNYFDIAGSYKFTSQANKTVVGVQFIYSDENTYTIKDFMLNAGSTALPYSPYFRESLPIPADALDGFGQGVNAQYYNKIVIDPLEGVKKYVLRTTRKTFYGTEGVEFVNYIPSSDFQQFNVVVANAEGGPAVSNKFPSTSGVTLGTAFGVHAVDTRIIFGVPKSWLDQFGYVAGDSAASIAAFKAFIKSQYDNGDPVIVEYPITPTETDVSHLFTDDNLLRVEAGGTITAVNEFEHEVPFTVKYMIKGA